MQDDTNLMLGERLTFFGAMRMNWFVLSAAWRIVVAFTAHWLFGGQIVSSTATARRNASGDIESVERLEVTYSNVTLTWEKRREL